MILDEDQAKDLVLSDGVVVPNVPVDIDCVPGKRTIERNPVCSFHEVLFDPLLVDGFSVFYEFRFKFHDFFWCIWVTEVLVPAYVIADTSVQYWACWELSFPGFILVEY